MVGDLEWLSEVDLETRERRIQEAFDGVATSLDGLVVFHVLLADLFFYEPTTTPEQQTLNNFAKQMLSKHFKVNSDAVTGAMLAYKGDPK